MGQERDGCRDPAEIVFEVIQLSSPLPAQGVAPENALLSQPRALAQEFHQGKGELGLGKGRRMERKVGAARKLDDGRGGAADKSRERKMSGGRVVLRDDGVNRSGWFWDHGLWESRKPPIRNGQSTPEVEGRVPCLAPGLGESGEKTVGEDLDAGPWQRSHRPFWPGVSGICRMQQQQGHLLLDETQWWPGGNEPPVWLLADCYPGQQEAALHRGAVWTSAEGNELEVPMYLSDGEHAAFLMVDEDTTVTELIRRCWGRWGHQTGGEWGGATQAGWCCDNESVCTVLEGGFFIRQLDLPVFVRTDFSFEGG